jgi:hypothetical protein
MKGVLRMARGIFDNACPLVVEKTVPPFNGDLLAATSIIVIQDMCISPMYRGEVEK